MPRQRRALDETDANAQPASKRSSTEKSSNVAAVEPSKKQTSTAKKAAEKPDSNVTKKNVNFKPSEKQLATGNSTENAVEKPSDDGGSAENANAQESGADPDNHGLANKALGKYICITRPLFDFLAEKEDEEGDEEGDGEEDKEEAAYEAYVKEAKGPNRMCSKQAAEHPDWKWVMMVGAWKGYRELRVRQTYIDPDNFGMHIVTDFYGYGINSLIESMLSSFDKEYKKKQDRSLQHMWILLTTLGHWLNNDETMSPWLGIDEGDDVSAMVELVGCAFLSVLDVIDHAKGLQSNSAYRDLGLVMSLYLKWSKDLPVDFDGEEDWREHVVAYAKKGGIDLKADGCYGVAESLEELEEVEPLQKKAVGRWNLLTYFKQYKEFKREFGFVTSSILFGLPCYDITKWPRKLRAKWNFDHVDPLADISDKDLKEGNLMLG